MRCGRYIIRIYGSWCWIKIPLEKIYERLNTGETLTDIYKEMTLNLNTYLDEDDAHITIAQELIEQKDKFIFNF